MSSEESPSRRPAIPTQPGRKRPKLGEPFPRFCASLRVGLPRSDSTPRAQVDFSSNSRRILSPFWTECSDRISSTHGVGAFTKFAKHNTVYLGRVGELGVQSSLRTASLPERVRTNATVAGTIGLG
jgi:hypothetical protein